MQQPAIVSKPTLRSKKLTKRGKAPIVNPRISKRRLNDDYDNNLA
jgi:hypothetical protein